MRKFASIRDRPTWITGWPDSGWRSADADNPEAKLLPFGFDITDDGSGYFVLVYYSMDRDHCANTWHETMPDAVESANQRFGIRRQEWGPSRDD